MSYQYQLPFELTFMPGDTVMYRPDPATYGTVSFRNWQKATKDTSGIVLASFFVNGIPSVKMTGISLMETPNHTQLLPRRAVLVEKTLKIIW